MSKAAELAKWGEVSTNGQVSGRRNIVINGAMNVAQRSASETGLGAAAGYFTLDRWKFITAGSAGRFTMSQTADGPNGVSANCLKLDCTTADTSIAVDEYLILTQYFEGQDLQSIGKGVVGAKEITVSFYVKANAAFTFGCELYDEDNTRQITKLFTTTAGWVRHELTFPADVDDGSSPFVDDNATSLQLNFWIHGGATFTGGTLNTAAWANVTQANRAAGIDSFYSSTDNDFYITGVQLEVGSVATPFEHRSFGEELALCQRYFEKSYDVGTAPATATQSSVVAIRQAGANAVPTIFYKQTKRALPTMTYYSSTTGASGKARNSVNATDVDISTLNNGMSAISAVISGSDTNYLHFHYTSDSEL